MIIEKINIKDNLRLEIVDKEDIVLSYKNNTLVSSCMSANGRWKYTQLYKHVKNLKLLRMMYKDTLVLRTLLWDVTDKDGCATKMFDKVYYKSYSDYNCNVAWCSGCRRCRPVVAHPTAYEQFKKLWSNYADVRNTAQRFYASLLPNKVKVWPYMDRFEYYNPETKLLSNKQEGFDGFRYYCTMPNIISATDHIPL